jgi:polo-like kinase 1
MENSSDIIERNTNAEGTITVLKRYQKGRFLGKGGFAKCYEVRDCDTGKILAAKIIEKSTLSKSRSRQKLMSEIKIHKAMNHLSVVKFEGYFEDTQRAYILLELCQNQTLKELLKKRKRLHELEAQYYMYHTISGTKYIHSQKVIHRDLKLGNLFLTKSMEIKIGDFGLAAKLDFIGEKRRTVCGTPNYIAPEVLNSKICGHSFEADVWSIGVILYAMLIGRPPFETKDVKNTYKRIRAIDYCIPEDADISVEAKSLIKDILVINPFNRPSLDDILAHPFMNKCKLPPQLPITTLTSPLDDNFITQYHRKSPKIEKPKVHSRTTTATSRRNSELIAKEQLKKTSKEFIPVETQMQKVVDPRCATAKVQFFKEPGVLVTKTNTVPTRDCVTAQTYATGPSPTPMLIKQDSTEFKALSGVLSQPRFIQGTMQSSLLNTQQITSNPTRIMKRATVSATSAMRVPDARADYVLFHQDYTDKYGIGYILTNGTMGFYYNDMTNLLWLEKRGQFGYSDFYNKGDKGGMAFISEGSALINRDLEKKLKIFGHFKKYYTRLSGEGKAPVVELPSASSSEGEVMLKRIIKTKNGILLRLANNIVQMIFIDQTQIALCFKTKTLVYINKKGIKESMKIANDLILTASEKIVDKFKYMLSLLNYINSNRGVHVRHMTANGAT